MISPRHLDLESEVCYAWWDFYPSLASLLLTKLKSQSHGLYIGHLCCSQMRKRPHLISSLSKHTSSFPSVFVSDVRSCSVSLAGTHYVDQIGPEFLPLPPYVWGLQAFATLRPISSVPSLKYAWMPEYSSLS